MEKCFLILLLIIHFSIQATVNQVDDLFDGLYSGDVYSGYLKTKIDGNELFYIYTPSQNNPSTDPIMLWLNGGPGCSSLFGFLAEIGPVTTENFSNEFKKNAYSWNTNANLLAIEQPAGVGFSKTEDPEFTWTDDVTADNLMYAIKDFLRAFNLTGREFYVSGESYAGVYIPFLATHILEDTSEDKVNLKGVLVGNGLTDFDTDVQRSMVEFGFYHGMVPIELYNSFKRNCLHKPDELYPEEEKDNNQIKDSFYPRNVTHKCNEIRQTIQGYFNGNDMYGIYRICPNASKLSLNDPYYINSQFTMKKTILSRLKEISKKQNIDKILDYMEPENDVFPESCGEDLTFDRLLNNETIKSKLAVDDHDKIWVQCSPVNYNMSDSLKFYSETMKAHPEVKVWFFSGTEDGVLPTLGTMRWINKLNLSVETKWKQYKVGDQVAGFAQKYKEGLVLVTVKGAGHMVPQDQRASAYKMVSAFFKGELPE